MEYMETFAVIKISSEVMPKYRGNLFRSEPLQCSLSARIWVLVGHKIDRRIRSHRKLKALTNDIVVTLQELKKGGAK